MRRPTSRRTLATALLAVICAAGSAGAHLLAVPVSTCAFDPLTLDVPARGVSGAADPAGAADVMRIAFDASSNQIQMCPASGGSPVLCATPVPRAFTLAGVSGTLTFPAVFNGKMLSSGDMTFRDVPIVVEIGGTTGMPRTTLTTALASVGVTMVQGAPLEQTGGLTLVGVLDGAALPPPLTGQSVVLSLSCTLEPAPDRDEFAPPIEIESIGGRIAVGGPGRIRAVAEVLLASTPDLTHGPVLLAVDASTTTIASAIMSGGLHGTRVLTGESDDGRTKLPVRSRRRGAILRLAVTVRFAEAALAPQAPGAPVLIGLTFDAGGIIGRGEQLFRADHTGRRLDGR